MITIHALGDSLVTAYGSDEDNFIGGWGDHLGSFFDREKVTVNVYGQGGRSSRSFLNEGRFVDNGLFKLTDFPYNMGPAYNRIKQGDYVLIQFCHNDDGSKEKLTYVDRMTPLGEPDENGIYPTVVPMEQYKVPTTMPEEFLPMLEKEGVSKEKQEECRIKYEELLPTYGEKYYSYGCGATYKGYLKFYIDKIRELGATPILVTAAARQFFKEGKITAVPGHHGNRDSYGDFPYIRAVRQLGQEEDVLVLDLFQRSCELFERLGESDAKSLQSIKDENGTIIGEARGNRPRKWIEEYDRYWEEGLFASVDDTHQNRLGSYLFAAILVNGLYENIPELRDSMLDKSSKNMKCPKRITHRIPDIEGMIQRIRVDA